MATPSKRVSEAMDKKEKTLKEEIKEGEGKKLLVQGLSEKITKTCC